MVKTPIHKNNMWRVHGELCGEHIRIDTVDKDVERMAQRYVTVTTLEKNINNAVLSY